MNDHLILAYLVDAVLIRWRTNHETRCCLSIGHGHGCAPAFEWYMRSSDAGNAGAILNLGVCYDYGRGVATDEAKAMQWYARAREAEESAAMFTVGVRFQ
jgi:TPR repeat protein